MARVTARMALPLTTLAQTLGNRVLRLDPETLKRLGEFDGKLICLRFVRPELPPLELFLWPSEAGFRIETRCDTVPDVTIAASSVVFARLALKRGIASGEMQISGNMELGQKFQRILGQIDIDWEEELAHVTGDVIAHQVGNALRAAQRFGEHAYRTLTQDAAEYLQEEARLLARRERVEQFLSDVDRLRSDVERLAKRLERLDGARP
jgi:ubiquinone biosynthesis protein UbiJ